MIYFDTSYLVHLYFEDEGYERVRELAVTDHIACAWHGQAEAIAAFHRKLREGAIRKTHYRALMQQFAADNKAGAVVWLPTGAEVLEKIGSVYAELPGNVYLRAADALHLATAALHGYKSIYSNDSHLLAAAEHFDLIGQNVVSMP
ncbi:MAG TPA: type II toxin-antitoxin system VapC family toxin [Opitutaceae bacterium]|nr:type II toxin-antitoxin system VapC family toxin [Opitutaceae bacterium]